MNVCLLGPMDLRLCRFSFHDHNDLDQKFGQGPDRPRMKIRDGHVPQQLRCKIGPDPRPGRDSRLPRRPSSLEEISLPRKEQKGFNPVAIWEFLVLGAQLLRVTGHYPTAKDSSWFSRTPVACLSGPGRLHRGLASPCLKPTKEKNPCLRNLSAAPAYPKKGLAKGAATKFWDCLTQGAAVPE